MEEPNKNIEPPEYDKVGETKIEKKFLLIPRKDSKTGKWHWLKKAWVRKLYSEVFGWGIGFYMHSKNHPEPCYLFNLLLKQGHEFKRPMRVVHQGSIADWLETNRDALGKDSFIINSIIEISVEEYEEMRREYSVSTGLLNIIKSNKN